MSTENTQLKNDGAKESFFCRFVAFLKKKGVSLSPRDYFVTAMSAMALGLFASLLMGTIFSTIGKYLPFDNSITDFFALLGGAGSWG